MVALGLLDRLGLWMEARGWIYWRKRKARGSVLGSTFLELQKIFESGKSEHLLAALHGDREEGRDSVAARLAADHAEVDRLFREAESAMEKGLPVEAHRAVDRIWMRLAVHIRAEHKALFPAVAATRPDLEGDLRSLREDHDFFMTTLATAVKRLDGSAVDWATTHGLLESVRKRLDTHNALEETRIYPIADRFPEELRRRVTGDVARELADLPARYHLD